MSRARHLLEVGSALLRPVPPTLVGPLGEMCGRLVGRTRPAGFDHLVANLAMVCPSATPGELEALAVEGFGSYARYWAETLRLPTIDADAIEQGLEVHGFEHIQASLRAGVGPIMVLPHLGGWEWAAAWLGRVGDIPISAVVEHLEPEDVFDWFRELRSSYGVNVISLGRGAAAEVGRAIRDGHIVCLLADRDLAEAGVEVSFFGAPTRLPIGPALMARRSGAPLLPTAVYFADGRRICRIEPPLWPDDTGDLRADLATTTQRIAHAFEGLIARAPEQWHVLEPIWGEPDQPGH